MKKFLTNPFRAPSLEELNAALIDHSRRELAYAECELERVQADRDMFRARLARLTGTTGKLPVIPVESGVPVPQNLAHLTK